MNLQYWNVQYGLKILKVSIPDAIKSIIEIAIKIICGYVNNMSSWTQSWKRLYLHDKIVIECLNKCLYCGDNVCVCELLYY